MSPTVRVPVTNGPAAARPAPLPALTVTPPALASSPSPTESPLTPLINMGGVESSTNELPLSAIPFGSRTASWPRLADGSQCSTPRDAGRRQRHSIAGQMSYLKMLGLGARGKLSAAGLFSTAVISGSSSAPNLRVMIPTAASSNGECMLGSQLLRSRRPRLTVCLAAAVEGFGGVPAIRPLETLHNALSLRQLDAFLERVTAAPVLLGTPPAPPAPLPHKQPSPTNSECRSAVSVPPAAPRGAVLTLWSAGVGWSGPSSLMSSSGELPSGLSSAGPSSPNSNYASNSEHKTTSTERYKHLHH